MVRIKVWVRDRERLTSVFLSGEKCLHWSPDCLTRGRDTVGHEVNGCLEKTAGLHVGLNSLKEKYSWVNTTTLLHLSSLSSDFHICCKCFTFDRMEKLKTDFDADNIQTTIYWLIHFFFFSLKMVDLSCNGKLLNAKRPPPQAGTCLKRPGEVLRMDFRDVVGTQHQFLQLWELQQSNIYGWHLNVTQRNTCTSCTAVHTRQAFALSRNIWGTYVTESLD